MIKHFLVIEDNEIDAYITKHALERAKISNDIQVKMNGDEAIDYLDALEKTHRPFPEIIFLDLNMPCMNGFEFLELFRTYPGDLIEKTCIVIVSSSSDPRDIYRTKQHRNVKEHLVKPLTQERLQHIKKCYADFIAPYRAHQKAYN